MATKPDVRVIAIKDIRENPVALRTVNIESEEYLGLCDSIKSVGVMNPINVRVIEKEIDGKIISYYELVDGLHRYTAAKDAGLIELPALVVDFDDSRTLEAQIMANLHKIETKPVEFTRQLQRVFAGNPTLTLAEMSSRIGKSPTWVSARLNLLKLDKNIAKLVDDGKIKVSNACQLAKLPPEEQLNYIDQAISMSSDEFVPIVQARAKDLREAAKQGRKAASAEFVPLPRLQKMTDLKNELERPVIGPALCKKQGIKDGPSGFALGGRRAINHDAASVEVRTAKDAEKKAKLEDEKKKRAAIRAKKKAEDAAKIAAKALEAVGASK